MVVEVGFSGLTIYSDFPSYGYRRMTKQLQRDGHNVGKKFVKKATKPKMTTANKEHYTYPYLLKDFRDYAGRVVIEQVNQVWSTDITYL